MYKDIPSVIRHILSQPYDFQAYKWLADQPQRPGCKTSPDHSDLAVQLCRTLLPTRYSLAESRHVKYKDKNFEDNVHLYCYPSHHKYLKTPQEIRKWRENYKFVDNPYVVYSSAYITGLFTQ